MMEEVISQEITHRDRKMAQEYVECALCRNERARQNGLAPWFPTIIDRLCPYRPAYERVYGRRVGEMRLEHAARVV